MDEGIKKRDISTEFKKIVDSLRRERPFFKVIQGSSGNKIIFVKWLNIAI
jgi:hypothetical protein